MTVAVWVADRVKRWLYHVQSFAQFVLHVSWCTVTPPVYVKDSLYYMYTLGIGSLPVILLTGLFTGMVLSLQSGYTLAQFGGKYYLARIVSLSMVRELGPVLTALMLAGRVGAGIASELGAMAVTEQVSALRAMGVDPVRKLVVPRWLALLGMAPTLTVLSAWVGLWGGAMVADIKYRVRPSYYWATASWVLFTDDVVLGFLKPFLFGTLIAWIGCYQGLTTEGGSQGVGRSTTSTVVVTSIAILVADYFFNEVFITVILMTGHF